MPFLGTRGAASASGFGAFALSGFTHWMGLAYGSTSSVDDRVFSTAVDTQGNFYVVGYSNNTGGYDLQLLKFNARGILQWQRILQSAATAGSYHGLTVDSSNNIYVTGSNIITTRNAIIAKYDTNGNILWQRRLAGGGGGLGDYLSSAAVDPSGNVYFGGGTNFPGDYVFLLAKYDSSGTLQWNRKLDNDGTTDDRGYAVTTDPSSNVYIVGISEPIGFTLYEIQLAKYNTGGTLQWQRRLSVSSQNSYGYGIAADNSSNVFVTGSFGGSGNSEAFLVKYNTSGTLQWQRKLGNNTSSIDEVGNSLTVDSSGYVYLCGSTSGNNLAPNSDILVSKYDTNGVIQWQRSISSNKKDYGQSISIDSSNNILIGGYINDGTTRNDMFIARLPNDGSKTGSFTLIGNTYTYSASSLTEAASSMTATTSTMTDQTAGLTSSTSTLTDSSSSLTVSTVAVQ